MTATDQLTQRIDRHRQRSAERAANPATPLRRQLAAHEAGHGIVAHELRAQITGMKITSDTKAHVNYKQPSALKTLTTRQRGMIAMAGQAAQKLLCMKVRPVSSHDHLNAAQLYIMDCRAMGLADTDAGLVAYMQQAEAGALSILAGHSLALRIITDELERTGNIDAPRWRELAGLYLRV